MEFKRSIRTSQKFFLTLTFWREAGSFRFRYSLFTHFMEQNMELIGGPRALYPAVEQLRSAQKLNLHVKK